MKKLLLLFVIAMGRFAPEAISQNTWTQKANFGGTARQGAIGFSIGTKGYIGLGGDASMTGYSDFWEWDQSANTWTQRANYPGAGLVSGIGFSIGTAGYVGTGYVNHNDFWKWDQASNTWSQKANFAGVGRYNACAFSIGTKGYVGTGSSGGPPYLNDFWEYDPATDSWTQKTNFPINVSARAAFSTGVKGYICNGWDYSNNLVSVYEYDPSNNAWTQKANFGGAKRSNDDGFSFAGKGYVGTGRDGSIYYSDFWEYDPIANSWTQRANFGGVARAATVGFSIGSKGYYGTGLNSSGNLLQDFWEYSAINNGVNEINPDNLISIYPNPSNGKFTLSSEITKGEIIIYNVQGEKVTQSVIPSGASLPAGQAGNLTIDLSNQPNGIYFLKLITNTEEQYQKIVKIQ
ncbi:MAG: T9SS type A sorting domain-containing protein [Bacteroidetes bacterium]|nr:T9SS type A sorting domain-containing protein [Bacteroidota bacterium]